jgi:hypothetical protein
MSGFLVLFGVWTWILWPNFLKNIWRDDRSWNDGPTTFFLIHLALIVVSFVSGNVIAWLGVRGLRASRRAGDGERAEELAASR